MKKKRVHVLAAESFLSFFFYKSKREYSKMPLATGVRMLGIGEEYVTMYKINQGTCQQILPSTPAGLQALEDDEFQKGECRNQGYAKFNQCSAPDVNSIWTK